MFENFLSVCKDVTKTTRKIPQGEYLSDGTYKIFDQGKNYIGGYCNTANGVASDYPYIVFGDHTRVIKYINEPCYIGADGVKLLKVYNNDFIPKFVYYAMLANPVEHQGYSRHFKLLKETKIRKYDKSIQNTIIDELDKINLAISLKESILNHLDELVKSRFIEMFGDPLSNSKGYDLSDYGSLFELNAGGTPSKNKPEYWENGNISWIGSNMCQDTILYENDGKYITELGFNNSSARMFPKNTVLVALVGATIGKTALLKFETTTNQNVLGIRGIEESGNNPYFVFYYTQGLHKFFMDISDGGFAMASKGFISKLPFPIVDISLQNDFADFVKLIDKSGFVGYFTLNIFYVKSSHFHHPP